MQRLQQREPFVKVSDSESSDPRFKIHWGLLKSPLSSGSSGGSHTTYMKDGSLLEALDYRWNDEAGHQYHASFVFAGFSP